MPGRPPLTPHLLVVEDDPASRALLVSYFVTEGYRVSEVDRGDGLLERLAADPAEVVLLDIKLPGMDGLTLTRHLRAQSEIGIILVTGKGDAVDRIVGLELGADAYVTKPFNPRELLAQVKTLLRPLQVSPRLGIREGALASDGNGRRRVGKDPRLHRGQSKAIAACRALHRDSACPPGARRGRDVHAEPPPALSPPAAPPG